MLLAQRGKHTTWNTNETSEDLLTSQRRLRAAKEPAASPPRNQKGRKSETPQKVSSVQATVIEGLHPPPLLTSPSLAYKSAVTDRRAREQARGSILGFPPSRLARDDSRLCTEAATQDSPSANFSRAVCDWNASNSGCLNQLPLVTHSSLLENPTIAHNRMDLRRTSCGIYRLL